MTTIHRGLDSTPGGIAAGLTDKTLAPQGQIAQNQTQLQSGTTNGPGEVEITPTAQMLASVAQQLAASPAVDHGRVEAIRQALNSGTYQVNASRLADGLLAAQKLNAQAAAGAPSSSANAFAATALLGPDSE